MRLEAQGKRKEGPYEQPFQSRARAVGVTLQEVIQRVYNGHRSR
jgi:hypothetical protein